jgi:glutathione peroxidase
MKTVHDFKMKDIQGKDVNLADYKGKVLLITNTASKCGLTPQYKDLENLYQEYKDKGFEILAFPSNQFMGQEPLEGEEIQEFCEINYGVTFKVFDKVDVKGDTQVPLFKFLSNKDENGKVNLAPKWNFQKYLVDKEGKVVDYYLPTTNPDSKKVKKAIEKLL